MDLRESIARSVATAGSAVVFAGATVVIALGALVLSGIPILAEMGLVAAATVAVTVLVAITVSPAVLRSDGHPRVVGPARWRSAAVHHGRVTSTTRTVVDDDRQEEHGAWYVGLVTRHPWLTVVGVVALLGVMAIPVTRSSSACPTAAARPTGSTAHTAYTTIADEFGPGVNGPIIAVATLPEQDAPRTDAEVLARAGRIATALMSVDGVSSVLPFGVSADKSTLAFQVVPTTGPADPATVDTVAGDPLLRRHLRPAHRHRHRPHRLDRRQHRDLAAAGGALPPYLLVVVGLSLVILMLVFRSIVVPVVATVGFLLSVGAAFGATVAVHQWGWLGGVLGVTQPGPLLSFMPIILIGVLFGLAMDYQMFLVSGMHEARAHGRGLPHGGAHRVRPRRQGRHRRGDHHDLGLPRVRLLAPGDGPADRVRRWPSACSSMPCWCG